MAMNLHSRKGFVKTSRFYALMFVALTGILGMVSPPDLVLMTVQAQTTQDRQAEADRLINQGTQQYNISQFEAALQSYQQALIIYREIKFRQGELWALGGTGLAYRNLSKHDKAIEFHLQSLAIALSSQLAVWSTRDYLAEKSRLVSWDAFEKVLAKVPNGEPDERDRL